ncbi:MAG: DPP IV N-terminal domain-containing protein, partial [Balneolaceae bacterium]
MKSHLSAVPVIILLICSIHSNGYAQTDPSLIDYPHNHLDWYTIESQNFYIHFQEGNYTTAQLSSKIAEEIYEPVTGLYNHQPDKKVSIILRDREDYSNGAAYFFDDKIEIWIPSLNTPFRGSHDWFRNVITHEFTHIVQLQASMKRSKSIPAIYFQWLSYEDVRRPDILYGFPNGIITFPFASVAIPAWFAEGTAQYQRSGLSYDYWDSHRDMLLRSMILDGKELSFTEMGIFSSKNSMERELAYNQGFSFTIFLVQKFSETILADISETAAENSNSDFSSIIKKTTGISGEELFNEWIGEKREEYINAVGSINQTESEFVENNGFLNFYPQYSPDGEWFAYLSNRNRDYSATSLILKKDSTEIEIETLDGLHQLDSAQNYRISHGFSSNSSLDFISNRFSFSPDGSRIAYSKAEKNIRGEVYQDLYIYNLDTKEHNQISNSRRLSDPSWHPENSNIAAVQQNDGYQNLVLYSPDNQEITPLTRNSLGRTVYNP